MLNSIEAPYIDEGIGIRPIAEAKIGFTDLVMLLEMWFLVFACLLKSLGRVW